jgi:hypothetical protein
MMAAGVVTVPLAELADEDGTPRSAFMRQAGRAFNDAEARNAGNPSYEPYPAGAHRHLGLIAEAVLAERAAMREAVASAMAAPGTSPESGSLSSQRVEVLATIFATEDRCRRTGPGAELCTARRARWSQPALRACVPAGAFSRRSRLSRRTRRPPRPYMRRRRRRVAVDGQTLIPW